MSQVKYIPTYWNCPEGVRKEANNLIDSLWKLVGTGASHWNLSIGGVRSNQRAKAKEIVCRAKTLEQLVKGRTSSC